jgi:chromosomal replication initiation ATPase DnaA
MKNLTAEITEEVEKKIIKLLDIHDIKYNLVNIEPKKFYTPIQRIEIAVDLLQNEYIHIKSRSQDVIRDRQIAHYICKLYSGSSCRLIGSIIGGKDHASVYYSYKTISNEILHNKFLKAKVEKMVELYKILV